MESHAERIALWRDRWIGRMSLPEPVRVRVKFSQGDARFWPELVVKPLIAVDVGGSTDRCDLDNRPRRDIATTGPLWPASEGEHIVDHRQGRAKDENFRVLGNSGCFPRRRVVEEQAPSIFGIEHEAAHQLRDRLTSARVVAVNIGRGLLVGRVPRRDTARSEGR